MQAIFINGCCQTGYSTIVRNVGGLFRNRRLAADARPIGRILCKIINQFGNTVFGVMVTGLE